MNAAVEFFLKSIPYPAYVCGTDQVLIWANDALIEVLGGGVSGRSCYNTVFGEAAICSWCPVFRKGTNTPVGSYEWHDKKNRKTWRSRTFPFSLDGESVVVSILTDVTIEKLYETRLRKAERLEAVGQLAGGIAHDFRNILGAIAGYADVIKFANIDDDGQVRDRVLEKRIEAVRLSSGRAHTLVDRLLVFSRYGLQNNVRIQINELVAETVEFLEHAIDKRIRIVAELSPDKLFIDGDPQQIHTALLNIAVAARDSISDGGTVHFGTRNVRIDAEFAALYSFDAPAGEYVEVYVKDTGIQLEKRDLERLFDPLYSFGETGSGTGLGLAAVRRILSDHGGFSLVENNTVSGSSYRLFFPLSIQEFPQDVIEIQEETNGVRSAISRPQASGRATVLVVDDEELIRHTVEEMLSRYEYSVTSCANGREAAAYFRFEHERIDIVVLDMMMPEMTGYDCFIELKRIDPGVKVIIGDGEQKDIERMVREGVCAVVIKPFVIDDIMKVIEKTLNIENGSTSV